jgi:hypothetical protein
VSQNASKNLYLFSIKYDKDVKHLFPYSASKQAAAAVAAGQPSTVYLNLVKYAAHISRTACYIYICLK